MVLIFCTSFGEGSAWLGHLSKHGKLSLIDAKFMFCSLQSGAGAPVGSWRIPSAPPLGRAKKKRGACLPFKWALCSLSKPKPKMHCAASPCLIISKFSMRTGIVFLASAILFLRVRILFISFSVHHHTTQTHFQYLSRAVCKTRGSLDCWALT